MVTCNECWHRSAAGSLSRVIFGIISFRYYATASIPFIRYSTPTEIQWDVDRTLDGGRLSDSPDAGEDARRRGWWVRWLVCRIISCPEKLGGCWEREKAQRAAKAPRRRRSRQVHWVEIAAACCDYHGESAPPTNDEMSNGEREKARGENTRSSGSRRAGWSRNFSLLNL